MQFSVSGFLLFYQLCYAKNIPSLIFSKITATIKGVALLPLSTFGALMQNAIITTRSTLDLSEGNFNFLSCISRFPFTSQLSFSIFILLIKEDAFCKGFINSIKHYLWNPLQRQNKWVMKEWGAKRVYFLHYTCLMNPSSPKQIFKFLFISHNDHHIFK